MLLAAPADDRDWTEDNLRDIVYDALDLAKVRLVDTDALQGLGNVLPMLNWFEFPRTL